eukprot:3570716-Rhodomonas_salina.2
MLPLDPPSSHLLCDRVVLLGTSSSSSLSSSSTTTTPPGVRGDAVRCPPAPVTACGVVVTTGGVGATA